MLSSRRLSWPSLSLKKFLKKATEKASRLDGVPLKHLREIGSAALSILYNGLYCKQLVPKSWKEARCSRNSTKIKNIQKSFLPERVIPYWNKLPPDVKNSVTVLSFKIKLEGFKKDMNSKSITNDCFFWNVSNEVLARIEGVNYISNKV